MRCPTCGAATLVVAIPSDLREYAPDEAARLAVCTSCLTPTPTDEPADPGPEFGRIASAVPDDPTGAVPLLLVVGLLPRLVLFREEITTLLDRVERAGVDPVLTLQRMAADPSLDPTFDLDRRVDQLLQLYE